MPDDLVDHWDAPPRRKKAGRGARGTLVESLGRWVPRTIGPALVAASAMLLAGQLFSAYRMVWPTGAPGQFQVATDDTSVKVGQVIAQPFTAVPVLLASLPLLVLAGLVRLPSSTRPSLARPLLLAASVLSSVVALVGVVLFVAVAAWTLATRGEIGARADGGMYLSFDPVVTFLTRGGDGLATAVLAAVAGWLLSTRSADVVTVEPATAGTTVAVSGDVGSTDPPPSSEVAVPAPRAEPAYGLGSVVPGSPAPFVTRGASEPSWQQSDPTVFRRPSTRIGPEPETTPDDAAPTSTDPALLFRRPVR